ncbi:MAG: hypothetical protein ACI935_002194 [Moritella dasanensis]|jgi:hypothetical protein
MKMTLPKTLLALSLFQPLVAFATEADNEPDLADLTKVSTALTLVVKDDSSGVFSMEVSGKYSADVSYMVHAEGEWNDEQEYSASRYQFYNVMNTGVSFAPKAGVSYDYFRLYEDNDYLDVDMHAIGFVSLIPISKSWKINLFPQVTYLDATFDFKQNGVRRTQGTMLAAYLSKYVGDNGSYFMLFPEYYKVSGEGVEYEKQNINLSWGSTITDDKKWWYILQYSHTEEELSLDGMSDGLVKNDIFKLKIRRFFF